MIATCYFIDTAKNIIEYLEVIHRALKPGGLWINLGPLLYHFEGMKNEMSIDLSLEEVKTVATNLGFTFEVRCLLNIQDDINNFLTIGRAHEIIMLHIQFEIHAKM